jgi:hypothetical protein
VSCKVDVEAPTDPRPTARLLVLATFLLKVVERLDNLDGRRKSDETTHLIWQAGIPCPLSQS